MRRLVRIFFPIILLVGILITFKSFDYYPPDFSKGYLLDKEEVFKGIFSYGLYGHITTAPLLLLISTALLFFRLETNFPALHRGLGVMYVLLVLAVSAPGGFILSFYAFGGWIAKGGFFLLSLLWAWFTYRAYRQAVKKDFSKHRINMMRSFILILSAVSLRILSFLFIYFLDWSGPVMYTWISWLSWLPFLMLYEWRRQRAKHKKVLIPA